LNCFVCQPASVVAAPARPKCPRCGSGGGAIHANLEALDAGIEPTWRCAWLVVDAGVVALMLAFHGVAALSVVVAQFVVNGAMFLFLFQALSGRWSPPAPELEAVMMVTVSAVARLRRRRRKGYGRMVFETLCGGLSYPNCNAPIHQKAEFSVSPIQSACSTSVGEALMIGF
jgi:hypothetical protein